MDNKAIKALKDDMLGWYWGANGPSPMLAFGVMMAFIAEAKRKRCMENGEELKRGECMFVAKDFCSKFNIPIRTFRTICDKTCAHNLTLKRHSTNKKATIITICNFNDYEPQSKTVRHQTDTKPTLTRHQTDTTPTNNICTHDNNINNKNFNNNKFQSSTAGTAGARPRARAGADTEKPPIFAETNRLSTDTVWLTAIAEKYSMNVAAVSAMIGPFRGECVSNGQISHKNINDCKRHFNYWLGMQLEAKRQKSLSKNPRMTEPQHESILVSTHEEDEKHREKIRNWIATQAS